MHRVVVRPRRGPLSGVLASLSRGNTFGDGGALRGIDDAAAAQLRTTDPIAATALRPLVSERTLRSGTQEWCLWLVGHTEAKIGRSRFLIERVERVRARRRTGIPPWLPERMPHPVAPRFAVPLHQPRWMPRVIAYELGVDSVIDASVVALDDPMTAGIIMSRVYRIWIETAGREDGPDISIAPTQIHNTFPCPDLSDAQMDQIEAAAEQVFMAIRYAMTRSLPELYSRDELPDALRTAHDQLDAIVDAVFGFGPDVSDDAIAAQLIERYQVLSAA